MNYFKNEKNVKDYIKMAEGYDGRLLIDLLKKYLPLGSSLLELGMGPGKDLDILSNFFEVIGSDYSQIFLDLYREKNISIELLLLDAITLETNRTFDCIYSNKVLHHLTKEDLKKSFQRQKAVLNDNGLLFHTFWKGDKEETYHGLRFVYYTEKELLGIIGDIYELIEIATYKEMSKNDSIYVILKKK
ncbi:MAG: class I SAM-dependent methyltransferase [Asgard group archaeon]|nr:class I SAM-dependent methyltransferase [Asgard group archaeon]